MPSGHMRIGHHQAQIDDFHAYAAAPEAQELGLQVLTGKALHDKFPYLSNEVVAGSYAPYDGHANPRLAAPAFARAAIKAGAKVRENTAALHIEKTGMRAYGHRCRRSW
ncbi:FAD-dependent oxidoreductase [Vibrio sp. PP-XX7]